MDADRWSSVESYFSELAELPIGEREGRLAEIADSAVRREVESLLQHSGSGQTITEVMDAIGAVALQVGAAGPAIVNEQRVGPYRVTRRLGKGGQGTVFEAYRDDGTFEQRVALKMVNWEIDGNAARERFRQERQILAKLEHPNIARLLGGGESESGAPYLAMEFIEGQPLTEACRGWTLARKLKLFLEVASAVAFAHRNLIVHRDLKPGNILITADGTAKLLDFGIAKLLDSNTLRTMTGMHPLTPDYASPEQVRSDPITTSSDIYSLGVVLYELLTGRKPYEVRRTSFPELHRAVCLTEPARPGVSEDLDNILLMAMRKEPERRYPSVEEFARDIERSLTHRPVIARKDTIQYRAGKFARRNALPLIAGAALVATLVGGIAVSTFQARRAERRFGQVRELANTFLFNFYDQVTLLAGSTAVRASIVGTAHKYLDGLANEAGNDQSLLFELAQAYGRLGEVQGSHSNSSLGQTESARQSFQAAMNLYQRLKLGPDSLLVWRVAAGRTLLIWSEMEYNSKSADRAEPLARRAFSLTEAGASENAEAALTHAKIARNLAEIRLRLGHASEALSLCERAAQDLVDFQARHGRVPDFDREIRADLQRAARAKVRTGDLDGALAGFQRAARTLEPCDFPYPKIANCRNLWSSTSWMANVYGAPDRPNLGQPALAAPLYQRSVDILEHLLALDSQDRQTRYDLATQYGKLGDVIWMSDPKRALDLYAKALTSAETLVSKDLMVQIRASYLGAISRPLILLGRTAEAHRALAELRQLTQQPTTYEDRLNVVDQGVLWGRMLAAEGKNKEAESSLEDSIRKGEALRLEHSQDLDPIFFLSQLYRELARITTGETKRQALLHSAAAWKSWPPTGFTTREAQKDLAAAR